MSHTAPDPGWRQDGHDTIILSGSWTLLIDRRRCQRVASQFSCLATPPLDYRWDLRQIGRLDNTGALFLWEIWGRQFPERLDLTDDQQRLFEWLRNLEPLDPPERRTTSNRLERLGGGVLAVLSTGAGLLLLIGQLVVDFGYCLRHPRVMPWREISANVYHIGAMAMLLLGSIGFLAGAVMTLQVGFVLQQFGSSSMVIGMMATAIPRELGAVIAGLLMAGRTGSAMTASIGAMHITEEYSALQAFGSSPSLRLALPRVIGAAISMPLLVIWTGLSVMTGSALAAQGQLGINFQLFIADFFQQVQIVNVWIGLGKGVLFGMVIALVGCHFGMRASPDTESMSANTTLSVVTSLIAVLLLDASLGAMMTNVGLM